MRRLLSTYILKSAFQNRQVLPKIFSDFSTHAVFEVIARRKPGQTWKQRLLTVDWKSANNSHVDQRGDIFFSSFCRNRPSIEYRRNGQHKAYSTADTATCSWWARYSDVLSSKFKDKST
jgi:hypothetical protein